MYKNRSRGFTLIELLVVIAIIGILSAVVLASLSTARSKSQDAAIRSNMDSARVQAELYYGDRDRNSYEEVCSVGGTENGIYTILIAAAKVLNGDNDLYRDGTNFSYSASGGEGSAVCHDSATGWLAVISLKNDPGLGWCVDSTGVARKVEWIDGGDDVTCN